MYDIGLVLEVSEQIKKASQIILERFKPVQTAADFTVSSAGMEKFDGLCLRLIAIGSALKSLDKITKNSLLPGYPQVNWGKAKELHDIISHQYFDVNAKAIFDVCETKIKPLADTIRIIIKDIKNGPAS